MKIRHYCNHLCGYLIWMRISQVYVHLEVNQFRSSFRLKFTYSVIVFKFWYSVTSKNGSSFPQGEKEASDWEVAKPDGIGERKKSFFCSLYSPFLIPFSSVHSQGNVLFFLHSNFSIFPIIVYNSRPYIIFLLWKRG